MRISDWSSDVCSSDLLLLTCLFVRCALSSESARFAQLQGACRFGLGIQIGWKADVPPPAGGRGMSWDGQWPPNPYILDEDRGARCRHHQHRAAGPDGLIIQEIGRASWRERVCQYV